jgi:hypothetical protein
VVVMQNVVSVTPDHQVTLVSVVSAKHHRTNVFVAARDPRANAWTTIGKSRDQFWRRGSAVNPDVHDSARWQPTHLYMVPHCYLITPNMIGIAWNWVRRKARQRCSQQSGNRKNALHRSNDPSSPADEAERNSKIG